MWGLAKSIFLAEPGYSITMFDVKLVGLLEVITTILYSTAYILWYYALNLMTVVVKGFLAINYTMMACTMVLQIIKLVMLWNSMKTRSFDYLRRAPALTLCQGCIGWPVVLYNRWFKYILIKTPIKGRDFLGFFGTSLWFLFWVWLCWAGFRKTHYLKTSAIKLGQIYEYIDSLIDTGNEAKDPFQIKTEDVGNSHLGSSANDLSTKLQKKLLQTMKGKLIQADHICIFKQEKIGEGMFGHVYKGLLTHQKMRLTVAIKVLNDNDVGAIVEEMKLNLIAGDNRNQHIIKFYGITVDQTENQQFAIVLEYCGLGSLDLYLSTIRHGSSGLIPNNNNFLTPGAGIYENIDDTARQNIISLLKRFAFEICSGMEHLAAKKVVHGDLSARNILLTTNLTIKISDFGMSKRLHTYQLYATCNQESLLPWRWMAVEAIEELKLSEKSDVWSYGITLWEIFSLGLLPYQDIEWSPGFITMLHNGMRMTEFGLIDTSTYDLMASCWRNLPVARPTFSEILPKLEILKTIK